MTNMSNKKTWKDKIQETRQTIKDIQSGKIKFFESGYSAIDNVLFGSILPGSQIIIAGATGMGKTMTMLNMALRLAQIGKKVGYFSLENSVHSLIIRLVANISEIHVEDIQRGDLSQSQLDALDLAYTQLGRLNLDIYDDIFNPNEICKIVEEEKFDVFFVDYVQILYLEGISQNRNRTQEIGQISKMLRKAAKLNSSVSILGAQLNREVSKRDNKRPSLTDLRDSGELEQDADVVMLLYRDEYYNSESEKIGILEVLVAKNREGRTGVTELKWKPEVSKVTDLNEKEEQFFDVEIGAKETIDEYITENISLYELSDEDEVVNF